LSVLKLKIEDSGVNFAVGVRNSHDKTIFVGLVAGRVVVCHHVSFFAQGVKIARKAHPPP
jgi:hypothetical protein